MKGISRNIGLLCLTLFLPLALLLALTSVTTAAETAGAFEITGGTSGVDYTYADGVLTVNTSTPLTVKNTDIGTPTTDTIVIATDVNADITLAGVNIDVSATEGACALMIANSSTGNVKITLQDGSERIYLKAERTVQVCRNAAQMAPLKLREAQERLPHTAVKAAQVLVAEITAREKKPPA